MLLRREKKKRRAASSDHMRDLEDIRDLRRRLQAEIDNRYIGNEKNQPRLSSVTIKRYWFAHWLDTMMREPWLSKMSGRTTLMDFVFSRKASRSERHHLGTGPKMNALRISIQYNHQAEENEVIGPPLPKQRGSAQRREIYRKIQSKVRTSQVRKAVSQIRKKQYRRW